MGVEKETHVKMNSVTHNNLVTLRAIKDLGICIRP